MRGSCARSSECAATPKPTPQPQATLTAHRGRPPDSEADATAATHVCRRCYHCYLATSRRQHQGRDLHSPRPRCAWLGPFFRRATREKVHRRGNTYESRMGRMRGSNCNVLYGPVRAPVWDQCGGELLFSPPHYLVSTSWGTLPRGEPTSRPRWWPIRLPE